MKNIGRKEAIAGHKNGLNRRRFLGLISTGLIASSTLRDSSLLGQSSKKHFVTFSFDDGFKESSIITARIFEKYGLSACINVIASAHLPNHELPDEYHKGVKGDFGLWRELQARGHIIMPHGYKHADLTGLPLQEAKDLTLRCIDSFREELPGFGSKKAVFNFPYNRSTPEFEKWLATEVRAFRTGGPAINPLPSRDLVRLTCISHGPGNIDDHLENAVNQLLGLDSGWLIYNTHGIGEEGWGPVSEECLNRLLDRLVQSDTAEVVCPAEVLAEVDGVEL